jgi:hypothetical protein
VSVPCITDTPSKGRQRALPPIPPNPLDLVACRTMLGMFLQPWPRLQWLCSPWRVLPRGSCEQPAQTDRSLAQFSL